MTRTDEGGPRYEWRGSFTNDEPNRQRARCFEHALGDADWWKQVDTFSLGWVCLRLQCELSGFVNVAWDGGAHAFLLDTMVDTPLRRKGHTRRLVEEAAVKARASGCEWLHVDFEPHLRDFYLKACKFVATDAGLIRLR
ncbi:GNAT family N-acetyltransferase [Ensifer sp. MJa1]|uniref:GNAT family N-acetyltransferase n=1 Tax=Ensifer sp. MJa1 TaxID=2919888 RepID=UPI003008F3B0